MLFTPKLSLQIYPRETKTFLRGLKLLLDRSFQLKITFGRAAPSLEVRQYLVAFALDESVNYNLELFVLRLCPSKA